MKNIIDKIVKFFSKAWWLEISTEAPSCEYYFGPFSSEREALQEKPGYLEDIEREGSQIRQVSIAHRQAPPELTIEYSKAA